MANRQRPAVLGFRCTVSEQRLIKLAAAASGETLSRWLLGAAVKAMRADLERGVEAIARGDEGENAN